MFQLCSKIQRKMNWVWFGWKSQVAVHPQKKQKLTRLSSLALLIWAFKYVLKFRKEWMESGLGSQLLVDQLKRQKSTSLPPFTCFNVLKFRRKWMEFDQWFDRWSVWFEYLVVDLTLSCLTLKISVFKCVLKFRSKRMEFGFVWLEVAEEEEESQTLQIWAFKCGVKLRWKCMESGLVCTPTC